MNPHYDLFLTLDTSATAEELTSLGNLIERWCDSAMEEESCDCWIDSSVLEELEEGLLPTLKHQLNRWIDSGKKAEEFLQKRVLPSREHLEEQAEAVIADSSTPSGFIHLTVDGGHDSSAADCVKRLLEDLPSNIVSKCEVLPALPSES